ncbi:MULTISPECIES: DUF2381 family protein [unclassified Corallococcus]|uniref:DUF2381 family protein n=1 Tax=unclassified Corallococcus TaxID=2685029 RepID=UPI001A8C5352|nr:MULTISPECIES: DUF2381 family protein [unclassified Corallococcus]MBN9686817.1 DUF2381 family protein [Corallococcus sp. NCSPR001]WAS81771.1 DUF2381 family protein [Corallococcus sp. NCRR]
MLLTTAEAVAREQEEPAVRTVLLSEHPSDSAPTLYVKGKVATVLRFGTPVDPARTRMLAWEGRFEPLLAGGRKVVVEPLQDLGEDDGVPLLVTLANGKQMPFLLKPAEKGRRNAVDQQVNVFEDPRGYDAMYSTLMDSLKQRRVLEEENRRLRDEEHSADHALATLLAQGDLKHTPFTRRQGWRLKEEGADILVEVLSSKTLPKMAVLFTLTNRDAKKPWRMMEARLSTVSGGAARAFALRTQHEEIAPGAMGRIAVVADDSAFQSPQGLEQLALELFRSDGLSQAYLVLEQRFIRE